MGSAMIIERAELGEVTAAATSVTDDGTGPSHQHRAPCDDAGHTRLKSLYISNVSYTCNYLGSRQNISIDSKVSSAEGHNLFHMTSAKHCQVL